jgi:thymidine phosphorylase
MGVAGVMLGGGRFTIDDSVDPAVGIVLHKKVGDPVAAGEALCMVHYNLPERFSEAMPIIVAAYSIGAQKPQERSLVQKVIQGRSV